MGLRAAGSTLGSWDLHATRAAVDLAASGSYRGCQLFEHGLGLSPVDAAVGDALAVDERLAGDERLGSSDQVALNHHALDAAISGGDLCGYIVADDGLTLVVLAAVGVAEVDHDAGLDAGLQHLRGSFSDALGVVVH